jgi:hypothetical protein
MRFASYEIASYEALKYSRKRSEYILRLLLYWLHPFGTAVPHGQEMGETREVTKSCTGPVRVMAKAFGIAASSIGHGSVQLRTRSPSLTASAPISACITFDFPG